MKPTSKYLFVPALMLLISGLTFGQTWNSNAGGYNTGYGVVYGSFGLAQATQNIYNTMQINMQRSMMRQAMINKWGRAAVEKAERDAANSRGTAARQSGSSAPAGPVVQPRPVAKNYGKFRSDPTVDIGKAIADALGTTPEEKNLFKAIFQGTKTAFETEVAAKGWKNDVAGALTFFLVTTSTIYHDAPDPSEEVVSAIYDGVSQSLDEVPELAKAPNKDKQALYDLLIGFAGIPLATYTEGKESGNKETINVARQLSGELIKVVLKTDPNKIRFDKVSQ